MRIISNFHDYYDCIANIGGHDSSIIYKRERRTKDIRWLDLPFHNIDVYGWHTAVVVLCGEAHWGYKRPDDSAFTWDDFPARKETRGWIRYHGETFAQQFKRDRTEINVELGSPVVSFDCPGTYHATLIVNPRLRDYDFAAVADPYTTFQRIEQFADTHFVERRPMVRISNEDRIAEHGFDKWSFRKMPTKRRWLCTEDMESADAPLSVADKFEKLA